jgi:hypothetical protein
MGIALATGGFFLGKLPVSRACRVGIMSGESGLATLRETARRIAHKAGYRLGDLDRLVWSEQLPRIEDLDHTDALERFVGEHDLEVLFLDPTYMMMSAEGVENLFAQGTKLLPLNRIMERTGCTIPIVHHARKGGKPDPFSPPELEDVAWAGFAEWCRQWILIGRRERYEPGSGLHRLWLNNGGSMGHSALWALDVDEGEFEPGVERQWEVTLSKAEEAREAAKSELAVRREAARVEKQTGRLEADSRVIVQTMTRLGRPESPRAIRERAGLSGTLFVKAWGRLLADGHVQESGEIRNGNRTSTAYTLNLAE